MEHLTWAEQPPAPLPYVAVEDPLCSHRLSFPSEKEWVPFLFTQCETHSDQMTRFSLPEACGRIN